MRGRLLIATILVLVVIFGIWRPLSGPDGLNGSLTQVMETVAEPDTPVTAAVLNPDTCGDSPPSRLVVGMIAHVALPHEGSGVRRNLVVRSAPNGEEIGLMEPGTNFQVTGELTCSSDGLRWWPISSETLSGWSVEGFGPDDYMMIPGQLNDE